MKNNDRYWDCLDQAMEASHGGRTDEALAWLDEALRAHPDGAEAHNGRGEILWDDGPHRRSALRVRDSLKADPKFITAHLNRAELLVEDMGEYEQAVALCDELLAGHTELPRLDRGSEGEVYYLKAKAVFYLDDLEGALFLTRRAMKTSRPRSRSTAPSTARSCSSSGASRKRADRSRRPPRSTPSRRTRSTTSRSCSSALGDARGAPSARSRPRTRSTRSSIRCRCASTSSSSSARRPRRSTTCRARSASTSRTCRCWSRTIRPTI